MTSRCYGEGGGSLIAFCQNDNRILSYLFISEDHSSKSEKNVFQPVCPLSFCLPDDRFLDRLKEKHILLMHHVLFYVKYLFFR
ncbi:hypothetical protein BFAG_04368 [Bacteroides fragilis 3_1_12]|uniref:Uncharacterized protein n=1 Tax=Bacteroides fragilis 3_1_12 TaxID=457424 RepID=A0ABN0BS05_BACFG|nr:hypothetical protein BFAG_04368 [Bacteroides fragilis 3_1_12]